RRAPGGSGAAGRQADLHHHPGGQPATGRDGVPGGAERLSCAAPCPSRLCHGQRPYHALGQRQGIVGQSGSQGRLSRGRAQLREGEMSVSILVLTFVVFVGGGLLVGQGLAETWRPWWQILPYGALLALGNQFLGFALFHGPFVIDSLVSTNSQPLGFAVLAYLFEALVIICFALFAFRVTKVRKLVAQYPW